MTQLAKHHDLTAIILVDNEFDIDETREAMQSYCQEVVLIANTLGQGLIAKRAIQLRSLVSNCSYERMQVTVPELQQVLDRVLRANRFDIVNLEYTFLGNYNFHQAPPGEREPALVLDLHNIDYDLARQYAENGSTVWRRLYYQANWRKLYREEVEAYRGADGICLCSADDERRLLAEVPDARTTVIPNAADVDYFQPRLTDPPSDGRTVVFFGLLSYVPNIDGVHYFVEEIWPRIVAHNDTARFKIIGGGPPPSLQALASPRVELTGFVPDLRPHLAEAALVVVPLRLGGGTRLKIVEAMAMGKAIVSTTLGAEGIEAVSGRDILIADEPDAFAAAVNHLLTSSRDADRMARFARQLAFEQYSWSEAARNLEEFYRWLLSNPSGNAAHNREIAARRYLLSR